MRERLKELGVDVDVVLVTFTKREHAVRYVRRHTLEVPVLLDPTRRVYRAFGLERGTAARVWSPKVFRRYYQILRRNGFGDLTRPTEDVRQLGGDFIIDPAGLLSYAFWSAGPDDRPSVDDVIAAALVTGGRAGSTD